MQRKRTPVHKLYAICRNKIRIGNRQGHNVMSSTCRTNEITESKKQKSMALLCNGKKGMSPNYK